MFTDRFVKVPVSLYDTGQSEMIGYNESTKELDVFIRISPLEISYYRITTDDNKEFNYTGVFTKSGESFTVSLPIEEFEKILNEWK